MPADCLAGIVVGALARYLIPDSIGLGADTLLGIVGGGAGGFIYRLFGHRLPLAESDFWSVAVAAGSALVLILVSRAAAGRRTIAP